MPTLAERYADTFPGSRERFERARTLFPCGVTHDTRMMDPFPVYVTHAKGSKKWDVDGHELIDYIVGHGSHILGHTPADVVKAVQDQMARCTHPGACHDLELEWADLVKKIVPSAERIRFTGSGTEATMMALRLARLYTGQPKFLKFQGHFHGWHDAVTIASDPPYDTNAVPGVIDAVVANCVAVLPNDLNRVEDALRSDDKIGSVILEPTGGHWGGVPIRGAFLAGLREICTRLNRVLIFDEVITGFRVAPGGAQEAFGVTPDLTTLAKILAGGLPGGCVAGRADILAYLEPRPGKPKMKHPGTYNANPLSASAGVATLTRVATGEPSRKANAVARELRNALNAMFAANDWPWVAYGDFSMIRVLPGYRGDRPKPAAGDYDGFIPCGGDLNALDGPKTTAQVAAMRQGMLLNGVDWWGLGAMTSCEHTSADVARTVSAMKAAIEMMTAEGLA
ncbi:aspartate aminotransferase family protein [Fimbriiglobus ruber]|uniref:Glutamate-1-semialdehyde aminotransferase n=1 Tax=Fimbriiglobus ruber TaxID=1908690 RepID=A0A225DQK3_9BACT|nr:aminotransferase class III-fold pyridoxal phosphate-dependent enzyme [Fimbriiglobus ruber]OWK43373.1 Glutamate-1-semialdehyde aminotransferase [Fimbriiglobus ruber]